MGYDYQIFIEWFAEPSLSEKLYTDAGLPLHIRIRGRRIVEPFVQIDALSIDEYNACDLSIYQLVLIELRDPTNVAAGVVAHMLLRPDGKAFEIIDHSEHIDYSDCDVTPLLLDTILNGAVDLSDWV